MCRDRRRVNCSRRMSVYDAVSCSYKREIRGKCDENPDYGADFGSFKEVLPMEYVAYQIGFVTGRLDSLLRSGNLAGDDRKRVEECVETLNDTIEHIITKEEK